jgi:hypothetical protein
VIPALTGNEVPAMSTQPPNGYTAEVSALDVALDMHISEIRARQDAGEITVRQAADLRVEALSRHLAAVKALRAEHFPEGDDA